MPANISGTPFNSFGISFIQKQSCWRKSDDILRCSMGQRTIKLSTNTLNNRILTSVARQSTKDINAWKRDEQTVYPSRVINRELINIVLKIAETFPVKYGKEFLNSLKRITVSS